MHSAAAGHRKLRLRAICGDGASGDWDGDAMVSRCRQAPRGGGAEGLLIASNTVHKVL